MDLTFAPLEDLATQLREAGVQAALDPAQLNLPGAWITLDTATPHTLDGSWQLACLVFLVVADQDTTRAMRRLSELYAKFAAVADPDGPVRSQGVIMPGDPTPLPALRVPVNLYT